MKLTRILFCLFFFFVLFQAYAQKDTRFRYSAVHKINERESYSIFYPNKDREYKGIIILIHSSQASNPKSYGSLIEQQLRKGYIVIYPSYQDFVASNNKKDIEFISSSLSKAYSDIQSNYSDVFQLPVALIGHSMGGIIVFELASKDNVLPKKPSAVISLCPAETTFHKLKNLNFNTLDSYDVYLILEEHKDRYHKKQTGVKIVEKLNQATRVKYRLHNGDQGHSRHMNAWAHDDWFSSKNNTLVSYTSRWVGRTNDIDKNFYWFEIDKALECATSRKNCEEFSE